MHKTNTPGSYPCLDIERFVSDPSIRITVGPRRSGTSALAEKISEEVHRLYPEIVVLIVDKRTLSSVGDPIGYIMDRMSEGRNCIILGDSSSISPWNDLADSILEARPETMMFCTTELCHQVPACSRYPEQGSGYSCSAEK